MDKQPKHDELVPISEAIRRTGLSHETIRKRIVSGELPHWIDGRDRRRKLVRVDDLARMMQPLEPTAA